MKGLAVARYSAKNLSRCVAEVPDPHIVHLPYGRISTNRNSCGNVFVPRGVFRENVGSLRGEAAELLDVTILSANNPALLRKPTGGS